MKTRVPEQRVQCWTEQRELFMMQAYAIQKHPVGRSRQRSTSMINKFWSLYKN